MASGTSARKRRKNALPTTKGQAPTPTLTTAGYSLATPARRVPERAGAVCMREFQLGWAEENPPEMGVSRKLEMLTPKGEHFIPCSTRVMFDGRISLDGIATAKTL